MMFRSQYAMLVVMVREGMPIAAAGARYHSEVQRDRERLHKKKCEEKKFIYYKFILALLLTHISTKRGASYQLLNCVLLDACCVISLLALKRDLIEDWNV